MLENLDGVRQSEKEKRSIRWLAPFVALVLASVAAKLTMALFWAASAFPFVREREDLRSWLLGGIYFFVQAFRGYVGPIGPRDRTALYSGFPEKRQIPQSFENGTFANVFREVHVAALAIIENNAIDESPMCCISFRSFMFHIVHLTAGAQSS